MNEDFNMSNLLGENAELGPGLEAISALFALEESQFKLVAPVFLDELKKSLNDPVQGAEFTRSIVTGAGSLDKAIQTYMTLAQEAAADEDSVFSVEQKDFLVQMAMIIVGHLSSSQNDEIAAINIPVELCAAEAKMPTYANTGDAGLDVYALEDITILPGETKLVYTGLKMAIPHGYELQVRPKSGRALKTKLRIANSPGTIDSGYRDEIGIIIDNIDSPIKDISYHFDEDGKPIIDSILHGAAMHIGKGEKFAQLVLNKIEIANLYQINDITTVSGNRGGGFGSTGVK